jgi:hypothetical protein
LGDESRSDKRRLHLWCCSILNIERAVVCEPSAALRANTPKSKLAAALVFRRAHRRAWNEARHRRATEKSGDQEQGSEFGASSHFLQV